MGVPTSLDSVWSVCANMDGSISEDRQVVHSAMRMFEILRSVESVSSFIWSSLDYSLEVPSAASGIRVSNH